MSAESEQAATRWMVDAACAGIANADALFFPAKGEDQGPALAVCERCPVRAPCLEYALALPFYSGDTVPGIWGGTSARERRLIRKARNRGRRAP